MRIVDFLPRKECVHRLSAERAEDVVRELGVALAKLTQIEPDRLVQLLQRREQVCSTAVGKELAMPHARTPEASGTMGIIGLSPRGVDFRAPDGLPVRVFVALVSPIHGGKHLHALAAVSRELADAEVRKKLLGATDAADVLRLLA